MNVHVVGAARPASYFAILMKKAWPQRASPCSSANKPDDTFASRGVLRPDACGLRSLRPRDYRRSSATSPIGTTSRSISAARVPDRRQRLCGTSRAMLLKILGAAPTSLGIDVKYGSEADPDKTTIRGADLVVRPDGINSRNPRAVQTASSRALSSGRIISAGWVPTARWTPSILLPRHAARNLHCALLSVSAGRSTWVMRPIPKPSGAPGLDKLDEEASARS